MVHDGFRWVAIVLVHTHIKKKIIGRTVGLVWFELKRVDIRFIDTNVKMIDIGLVYTIVKRLSVFRYSL